MKKIEEKIQQLEKQIFENHIQEEKKLLINEMKKIGIEKLPYSYPFVDGFYYHINQTTKEFILYALNEIVISLPNDDTKIFRTKKFGDARVRVPFPYSFLNQSYFCFRLNLFLAKLHKLAVT